MHFNVTSWIRLVILFFEQASHILFIWFTQELDYKVNYAALTVLKITSILNLIQSVCGICIWPGRKKSQTYISNRIKLSYRVSQGFQVASYSRASSQATPSRPRGKQSCSLNRVIHWIEVRLGLLIIKPTKDFFFKSTLESAAVIIFQAAK